jgi:hypothetical protein
MSSLKLSQLDAKNAQLSGWVRQLQKQIVGFRSDVKKPEGAGRPPIENQVLFVQQQYELLSILYEVSLGLDNPDCVQKIIGVDVDRISQEVARLSKEASAS